MKIEEMEAVLADYVKRRSASIGQPIKQEVFLTRDDSGIRVNDRTVTVSLQVILDGTDLEDLVDRIIALDWQLLHSARREKRRIIEKEKKLATAHIHELQRLCTIDEFNFFLESFKEGQLCLREEGECGEV